MRSYKFRLRPTRRQEVALVTCLEDTRQLCNAALEERREAWRRGHHRVTYYSQDAQLKEIRAQDPERYGRWSFSCERAVIKRLDRAFQAFFRRCMAGEKPGYPRFRGRGWWDSVEWPAGNGASWDSVPHPTVTRVYLRGVGHVRVHPHRVVAGRIKTITVKREADRWYVTLACDDVPTQPLEPVDAAVGAGRTVIAVDPRHTSQRCAQCGHTGASNRVSQAEFRCLACGHHANADVNAARNILRAGLALQEARNAA